MIRWCACLSIGKSPAKILAMATIDELKEKITSISEAMQKSASTISSAAELEAFRIEYLGRKGKITALFKLLGSLPPEERAAAGKLLNELKARGNELFATREKELKEASISEQLSKERVDLTLPGIYHPLGHLHLLTQVQREIEDIFLHMGFDIASGPEIETEYHAFEALNIPANHPARDEWDTFYIDDTHLLRPHTSPVQIRVMKATEPPVRVICPGRCYRRDTQDATHSPVFHQVELLWVEEGLSLANLKYVIEHFVHEFFGEGYEMRMSGDFFPFTEPSVQVHMRAPGATEWLEIMGAGMVDPAVLTEVGYDPEKVTGFAFGLGVERMAMLRHKIDDIRVFLQNDLRFITQF